MTVRARVPASLAARAVKEKRVTVSARGAVAVVEELIDAGVAELPLEAFVAFTAARTTGAVAAADERIREAALLAIGAVEPFCAGALGHLEREDDDDDKGKGDQDDNADDACKPCA